MKEFGILAIGAAIVGMMGLLGFGRNKMDKHKKKLDDIATAAQYAKDPETIANLNLHATLVVGELLVDVKMIGRDVFDRLNDWDKELTLIASENELTTIRQLLEKLIVPDAPAAAQGQAPAWEGGFTEEQLGVDKEPTT